MNVKSIIYSLLLMTSSLASCEEGWLEAKPNKSLIIPRTLHDYQLLLNNRTIFGVNAPVSGEIAADDAYVPSEIWKSLDVLSRNTYIWANDIYEGGDSPDWDFAYTRILHANLVMEGVGELKPAVSEEHLKNSIKGQALFYRALGFYQLSQLFCKPYGPSTATTDLGIPLKLTPEVNEMVSRGTLAQTYEQIINDLHLSRQLLPATQEWKTMPTKSAASGLLARVCLTMGNYDEALKSANESLESNNNLLDYNSLDPTDRYPLPLFNEEVVWHGELGLSLPHSNLFGIVDSALYDSYEENDLRKVFFFNEDRHFRGSYTGDRTGFNGIAADELYLIKAECLVRKGEITAGLSVLNTLLIKRWRTDEDGISTYTDKTADNQTEALRIILEERRKELIMRGLRWADLRRLNQEERFQKNLIRIVNGETYTLPPNDPRYTFLIPQDEIDLSGIEQNQR